MKIVNKNFPSNNSYFSEPKEHLYLHTVKIARQDNITSYHCHIFNNSPEPLVYKQDDGKYNFKRFCEYISANYTEDNPCPVSGLCVQNAGIILGLFISEEKKGEYWSEEMICDNTDSWSTYVGETMFFWRKDEDSGVIGFDRIQKLY